MKRPPLPVRVGILVAALALLGLAMCARSKPPAQPAATPPAPTQQVPDAEPKTEPPQVEEGDMSKQKPRDHFPATKAPGRIY